MLAPIEICLGIVLVILALYYYFTAHFNFWKDRGIPGPKPIPVFGNTMRLILGLESTAEFSHKLYMKYRHEPMIGIFEKRTPVLVVFDPEIVKTIMIKDFSKFANRGMLERPEVAEPLSQHLFALEAKRWRPLRSIFSPSFTSGKLKNTFSLILECANQLEKYLDVLSARTDIIDVRDVASRYTIAVIASCAFGIEANSFMDDESVFNRIGRKIFATDFQATLVDRFKECATELYDLLGYILPYDEVTKFITQLTVDTIQYRDKNNIYRPDFMNTLLELKKNPEKLGDIELTDFLLAAQAFAFFAAGFETSSTTISNAIYELALNHDIQEKLRAEIKEFEAKSDGQYRYETLKEMSYLDKVFKETLRKYPPLPFLHREVTETYTFDNAKLTLQPDSKVWIPAFAMQRDPDVYLNPEVFDPERFTEEAINSRHPMYYLPFGHGPRNCVGARFAVYQVKIGLIKTLRKYKVDICSKTQVPYQYNPVAFVMCPKNGIFVKILKAE